MKNRNLSLALTTLAIAAFGITRAYAQTGPMSQAELEKIVNEIAAHAPKYPEYQYPIKVTYSEEDILNARAHLTPPDPTNKDKRPIASITVFKKFADFMNNDRRLLRGVISHEIAHLSRGHVTTGFLPQDLSSIHTRQQELDADAVGASLLQRCGYSKQDVIDFLQFAEDKLRGQMSWLDQSLSDHPSFQARIANVSDNPAVARSLAEFDYGILFMENRLYGAAVKAFERSLEKQPGFVPAYQNIAQGKLMSYYYDVLPAAVRSTWFAPDFGPFLTNRGLAPKSASNDLAPARKAYREAVAAIQELLAKDKTNPKGLELLAIAQVLDPDLDAKTVREGVSTLESLAKPISDVDEKLRFANNIALGKMRLRQEKPAIKSMMDAQRSATSGTNVSINLILASNFARVKPSTIDKKDLAIVEAVTYTYLNNTDNTTENRDRAISNYTEICKRANLKPRELSTATTKMCSALAIRHKGEQLVLLSPSSDFVSKFGAPSLKTDYDKLYPDLQEMMWTLDDLTIISQGDQVLRITTYADGDSLILRTKSAVDPKEYEVKIGMSLADLETMLSEPFHQEVDLLKTSQLETWRYFPEMGFGVRVNEAGNIDGLTVTPIA